MGYYGMVIPAYTGHLNPMTVLGRALQRRGHRVVLISPLDAEAKVRKAGLEYLPIAAAELPQGAWTERTRQVGQLSGWKAAVYCSRWLGEFTRGILRDLPKLAARERFDGIIMDQISIGTECVCAAIGMPLAVACAALMLHFEWGVPPAMVYRPCQRGLGFRLRNLADQLRYNATGVSIMRQLIVYRLKRRLPPLHFDHINELPPSRVQVSQQPACFDFPRRRLPKHFHYTGPWKEADHGDEVTFPWDRLDGRPLIYASLGTLQNGLTHVFGVIAQACAGLDAQLVIALGSKDAPIPSGLPGAPVVVGYAPQLQLLKRASLVITHAGLNTVLESLSEALPLVAIPIAHDQPGVAARIEHLRLGRALPLQKLNASSLRDAVSGVLHSLELRTNARACADQIQRVNGAARAAELLEAALGRGQREAG